MRRACDIRLVGCPGVDAPITNISAEAPDRLLFAATVWDPYRPYRPPILGDAEYVDTDCNSIFGPLWAIYDPVVYADTQILADLIALATQLGCGHPEVPPEDPNAPTQVYINDAQTSCVFCPDGSEFCYTVEAGTLTSPQLNSTLGPVWVDWANAWAGSYALEQASALRDCFVRTEEDGNPNPPLPPPGINFPTTPTGPPYLLTPVWMCLGEELWRAYFLPGALGVTYTISLESGQIPPGTTLEQVGPRKAVLSGTPTVAGFYDFTIRGVSGIATARVADTIAVFGLVNPNLPNGTACTPYTAQLQADGGTPPYVFTPDPDDPPPSWMNIAIDGAITGTPDADSVNAPIEFTVTLGDSRGGVCGQKVHLIVDPPTNNCFNTTTLPGADTEGTHYSQFLVPHDPPDPGPNYTFTLLAGSLPAGLSLDSTTGEISGTPGPPSGLFPFTVGLTGVCWPCQQDFSILARCHGDITDTLHGQTYSLVGEGLLQEVYYVVQRTGVGKVATCSVSLTSGATDNISITASVGVFNEEGHFAWGGAAVVLSGGTSGSCDGPIVTTAGPNATTLDSCVLYSVTLKLDVRRINALPNPVSCPTSAVLSISW